MTAFEKIWQEIAKDSAPAIAVVRRVLPDLPHDVHLGEERPHKLRFVRMVLHGAIGHVPPGNASTTGLDVKVILETQVKATVQITERNSRSPQFEELAEDLLSLLAAAPGPGATAMIVERLLAWKAFFGRQSTLSAESAAGLFGELLVLTDLMIPVLGAPASVQYWTGPDRSLQDFQLPAVAVEVKTWRGGGPGELKISSERQLDQTGVINLIVAWVHLDERTDGTGRTLLDQVMVSRSAVSGSASAAADLDTKLLKFGWRDELADVRNERYAIHAQEYFRVQDGFPRLTPSGLPVGIGAVSYRIDRSAIDDFVVDRSLVVSLLGVQ